jgi:hypothetical protein
VTRYAVDEMSGLVLETAAPDSGERWNGFAVPDATANELRAWSDACRAAGYLEAFRVMRFDDQVALVFPCAEPCDLANSDAHDLGDGLHFHMEEA